MLKKAFIEVFSHARVSVTFGAFDDVNIKFIHGIKQKTGLASGSYLFVAGLGLEPRTSGL